MVEDGYEFFAKRQLVTLFSAPNYRGEFDNAAAMMNVDETLCCSFQVGLFSLLLHIITPYNTALHFSSTQILKPAADRRKLYLFSAPGSKRSIQPQS